MQIILLSGGSGKRLWPLSNNTRSKQFLKLLKNPQGAYESMMQRVYRQIQEAGIAAPVTIATSVSQADAIKSQLGGAADIVLEPERRNTYPAIALACAYLAFEKRVSRGESVVVLPVDPFAERAYFETLLKLDEQVQANAAALLLMGVQPTYPSEKYGYIVPAPAQSAEPFRVLRFTEKPSLEEAKSLIAKGAVWNAGVFAFRLGWLLDQLAERIAYLDYRDLLARYGELKKDSFDYEVVEKTDSIAMVSYHGVWKDLGTWNTLTEEMESESVGACVLGEGTTGTHVINELGVPLVVLGARDMVVAASPDGILVADKQKSSYIKPYVDGIEQRPMYEERRWGDYTVLDYHLLVNGQKSLTKHICVLGGRRISYQRHARRDEVWTILDGEGELLLNGERFPASQGDVFRIPRGTLHAVRAVTDLHLIEVQLGDDLVEEDIERLPCCWDE